MSKFMEYFEKMINEQSDVPEPAAGENEILINLYKDATLKQNMVLMKIDGVQYKPITFTDFKVRRHANYLAIEKLLEKRHSNWKEFEKNVSEFDFKIVGGKADVIA